MSKIKRKQENRTISIIIYVLFLLVVLEITCRLFFFLGKEKIPFFEPRKVIYLFYPELKIVDEKKEGTFDILLLGGSVLHENWGDIENILYQELSAKRKIKIYNLSMAAHSSLDAYYKYKFLQDRKFDLTILYQGINEARANNCPDVFFKDDYSHYSWYGLLNAYEQHKELSYMLFPYYLHRFLLIAAERCGILVLVPQHGTKKEWLSYGRNIKTTLSFRRNVENILKIAGKKNEKILLMTFAFYIPENYTRNSFDNKSLDYGRHRCPIEVWGEPENVKSAILAHNKIIKDLAGQYRNNVIFVDQYNNIFRGRKYFDDICHLTHEGCKNFVENMKDAIIYADK
ncbi:MAG: hypothetical protein JW734_06930 [Candidatus Omnitrophica bacterium]|nr:hypothetical protein [Candidatus Omnitrophota bacterium]